YPPLNVHAGSDRQCHVLDIACAHVNRLTRRVRFSTEIGGSGQKIRAWNDTSQLEFGVLAIQISGAVTQEKFKRSVAGRQHHGNALRTRGGVIDQPAGDAHGSSLCQSKIYSSLSSCGDIELRRSRGVERSWIIRWREILVGIAGAVLFDLVCSIG